MTDETEPPTRTEQTAGEGPTSDEKASSPEEIRAEIEQTREALGDTVEALAAKSDVKARAGEKVTAAKESLRETKDEFVSKASQVTPDSAAAGAQQFGSTVQEKPLPFATAGAFVAGVAVGWLLGRR